MILQKKTKKIHNPNQPEISDHSYRILIVGGPSSGKTNALLNLINHERDIDKKKNLLYAKDRYEAKQQLLINNRESTGLKYLKDLKAFIKYSNDMNIFTKILKNALQIKNEKY